MVLVGPEQINAGLDAKWPGLLFCPKKWLRHTSKPCLSPLQIFNLKMRRASSALPPPTRIYKDKEHTSRKKLWESFSSVGLTLHFYNCLHFNQHCGSLHELQKPEHKRQISEQCFLRLMRLLDHVDPELIISHEIA